MAEPVERVRKPYDPDDDKRTDRLKRGRCGRVYCFDPAAWVWIDKGGNTRHECNRHAGMPNVLEDGDERVREGLRRENNGLIAQRLAAIQARDPSVRRRSGWIIQSAGAVPVGMVWATRFTRI